MIWGSELDWILEMWLNKLIVQLKNPVFTFVRGNYALYGIVNQHHLTYFYGSIVSLFAAFKPIEMIKPNLSFRWRELVYHLTLLITEQFCSSQIEYAETNSVCTLPHSFVSSSYLLMFVSLFLSRLLMLIMKRTGHETDAWRTPIVCYTTPRIKGSGLVRSLPYSWASCFVVFLLWDGQNLIRKNSC